MNVEVHEQMMVALTFLESVIDKNIENIQIIFKEYDKEEMINMLTIMLANMVKNNADENGVSVSEYIHEFREDMISKRLNWESGK